MKHVTVREIDLHGLAHKDAVNMVEEIMLMESTRGNVDLRIITGKSKRLQEKLIEEICLKWGFDYLLPSDNPGIMIIEYIKL